jgi:hypothetical protein
MINIKVRNNPIGIQRGEVTHHQDQLATGPVPVNFSTRKTKNTKDPRPIPLVLFDLLLIIFLFFAKIPFLCNSWQLNSQLF